MAPQVRDANPVDRPAVDALHDAVWGGPVVVGHGRAFDLRTLPALVAEGPDGRLVGALAYEVADSALEVVSIVADPYVVPTIVQSCAPSAPSLPEKYSVPPATFRNCGLRPAPAVFWPLSRAVVAAVPPLAHSCVLFVASVPAK